MKRPNFEAKISQIEASERSSSTPISTFIPHQALDLKELISRFDRGQRLNVHQNFAPLSNFTSDKVYEESFDDAPPDNIHDIVDVHNALNEHAAHKKDFADRRKKKSDAAKQADANQAQQAKQHDTPPDPANP